MRKLLPLALLVLVLSVPALAGDTGMPPCKENCGAPAVSGPSVKEIVLAFVLTLIKK